MSESEPVRILHVESVLTDAELAEREICKTLPSSVWQRVEAQRDFLAALAAFQPDLILADCCLPEFDGRTVLELTLERAPFTPLIILAGIDGEDTAVACVQAGATDYVIKEHIKRLGLAVLRALEQKELRQKSSQIEKTLREKVEELDRFFTVVPDLLCIADTEGYFHRLNPQWKSLLGYSLPEIEGKNFLDLVHPDDLANTMAAVGELESQKTVLNFENRYRCQDGSYRWLEWRSYPAGNLIYGAARDITDRKRAEEALQQSQLFLSRSQSVAQIGSYYFDVRTGNWISSPVLDEIFGIDENFTRDVAGWLSLIHPEHRDEMNYHLTQQVLVEHNRFDKVYRIVRHDDGQECWIHGLGELELDESGSITKMIGTIQDVTKRRQAEKALHLTRFSVDNVADAVYWIDPEARLVDVNETACRMLGYTRQELLNMSLSDIDPNFSIVEWPHTWQQIKKMGKRSVESQHQTKEGQLIPVEIIANIIEFEGQELDCAVVRDITERKAAEKLLRESEERLQLFSDVTTEGIFFHHQGVVVDVNRPLAVMFGYDFAELVGRSVLDFIAPEWRESVTQRMLEMTEDPYEALGLRKDGSTFPVEVVARTYEFQGQIMRVVSIRDVTERKQTEAALRESEERLRQAVRVAGIGIFDHDHLTDTIYTSPEFRKIGGWKPEETVSLPKLMERVHTEDLEQIADAIRRAHDPASDGFYEVEHRVIRPDGAVRWQSVRSQTFFGGEGDRRHPVRTMGAVLDVTEAKLAEKAQVELEERLRQAQKLESIGQLAGGIAHDFNNLLVPMIGYAELGQMKSSPNSELSSYLKQIRTAAERAAGLTRQILAFSRRQVLKVEVIDLNETVTEFQEMLRRLIGESIELQVFLATTPCLVTADRTQIEQILLNLSVNARDAMPNGGQLIIETDNVFLDEAYAQTRPETRIGYHVMLSLSDTGHGIDNETQQHIFEPFFTTKKQGRGTGLGLATVFGIVKQHGGNIWVYSEPDKGTTFKIYLPRSEEAAELTVTAVTDRPSVQGTETVMVVEDEPMVRKLACETLEAYGYTVLEAKSPADGLHIAAAYEDDIHLLLTDVIMPGMNGRELYQKMSTVLPELKVMYMSGYTDNVIVHHGVLEQGVNFLQKPFTVRGLAGRVRKVLD